jgi:hypothetical protein
VTVIALVCRHEIWAVVHSIICTQKCFERRLDPRVAKQFTERLAIRLFPLQHSTKITSGRPKLNNAVVANAPIYL